MNEVFELPKAKCQRCGHVWTPRGGTVTVCPAPSCHSPYWNTPKAKQPPKRKKG